jgi:hypothetical protein
MEWTQFLILIVTVGGLFFWNRSESNSDRRAMQTTIDAIKDEMKDFHGRLERQDAEFKAFLRKEEEKRTGIIMSGKH